MLHSSMDRGAVPMGHGTQPQSLLLWYGPVSMSIAFKRKFACMPSMRRKLQLPHHDDAFLKHTTSLGV